MNLTQKEKLEIFLKMQDGFANLNNQRSYYENISIDDLLKEIEKRHIHITEKEVTQKYMECMDSKKTNDYFYKRDLLKWDKLDREKDILNSDALYYLIEKIVEKNYDIEAVCDPYYIADRIDNLEFVPKNQAQEKILGIIMSLVEYAKRNNLHLVDGIIEAYDINLILKDEIKRCHQRDASFKKVIQSYYDTFEDADRSIYKLK